MRQDLGDSFAGVLATGRVIEGGGYNAVVGGDFHWQAGDDDIINGQYLYSFSQNPDRPDLYPGWVGQKQSGFGWQAEWIHSTTNWEWNLGYADFAPGFLADDGFVPQVGYREGEAGIGYRFFPTGFFSRLRPLAGANYETDREGDLIARSYFPGIAFQAKWSLRGEINYNFEAVRIDGRTLEFDRFVWSLQASPSRWIPRVTFAGNYGQQPDVSNVRVGNGGSLRFHHDPAHGPSRARPARGAAVDRRDGRRPGRPPVHGDRGPREGDLRVQRADVLPRDRPVPGDDARPGAVDLSRSLEGVGVLPGPLSSPTSSTGRPCFSSATGTTVPSSRPPASTSAPRPPVPAQALLRLSEIEPGTFGLGRVPLWSQ